MRTLKVLTTLSVAFACPQLVTEFSGLCAFAAIEIPEAETR